MKKILTILILFSLVGCSSQSASRPDIKFGASLTSVATEFDKSELKTKYKLENSALKTTPKDNPKDRIEVSVGNESNGSLGAAGDFEPTLNIKRWDNEVSLSIKKDVSKVAAKDKKVSFKGDKIIYDTPKEEYNFYEVADSTTTPEGAYEFEVILKEKPATNVVSFTIQDSGVEYFYQPALTQQEIDEGASRPENVIGSYAVYASEQKTNYVGGKEYKVGKVGHIYRPKIIDSAGTEVWGELHIENGILSVTIPQDFLDEAVYPVKHAAGLTFGYTGNGASGGGFTTNYLYGSKYDTSSISAGTVDKISVYAWSINASSAFKGVLLNSSYAIVTNGVGPAKNTTNSWAWYSSNYSTKPTVTAAVFYPSIVCSEVTLASLGWDSGSSGDGFGDSSNSYSTPTDPTDYADTTNKYSIYATYTAGGGGAAPASANVINFE